MKKVTFILGNGFDLGLGLRTSYNDVYESYVKYKSDDNANIRRFKAELSNRKPYDKWSDFEMGMAEYAKELSSEEEFIECVRDFKKHIVDYLSKINDTITKIINTYNYDVNKLAKELKRSETSFYQYLTPNVVKQVKDIIADQEIKYNYITFNYTTVLEYIFAMVELEKPPLHIHGTLGKDVVLGVDNIEQLNDIRFELSKKGKRAFIKTEFNKQYDKDRVETAMKIINESDIICTYGFSMGDSDRTWVNALIDWMIADKNHHLVVYQYDTKKYNQYYYNEIMDVEEDKKENLIEKLEISDKRLEDQIHIPILNVIFNFSVLFRDLPSFIMIPTEYNSVYRTVKKDDFFRF